MESIFKNSECSVYQSGDTLEGNYTTSLLEVLSNPLLCNQTIIDKVRSLPYGSDMLKATKVKLTAATFSSVQAPNKRGFDHHIKHSGFIQFDIDCKDNHKMLEPQGFKKMKELVMGIKYTAYCGSSASGMGIWGLFKLDKPLLHSEHFEAMFLSFKNIGVKIDTSPRNVASLRFISYDPEGYFNHDAKIFNLVPKAKKQEKKEVKKNDDGSKDNTEAKVLLATFNETCDVDVVHNILVGAGWTYWRTVGDKIRYTRPGKKSGTSGDYHTVKRTFTAFSSAAPGINWMKESEKGVWSASPVTLLLNYECKGTWAKVFEYIKTYN